MKPRQIKPYLRACTFRGSLLSCRGEGGGTMTRLNLALAGALWGLAVVIFGAIVLGLRRIPTAHEPAGDERWQPRPLRIALERLDFAALSLIAATGLLMWIGRRGLFPLPPDNFYHLFRHRQYCGGEAPAGRVDSRRLRAVAGPDYSLGAIRSAASFEEITGYTSNSVRSLQCAIHSSSRPRS